MTESQPILCQSYGSTLVIQLQSENLRDQNEVMRLRDVMLDRVSESQARIVILDFAKVRLVGSVAFLAFLALRRHAAVERVIVCELSEHVLSTFQLCKLISDEPTAPSPFVHVETLAMCGNLLNSTSSETEE